MVRQTASKGNERLSLPVGVAYYSLMLAVWVDAGRHPRRHAPSWGARCQKRTEDRQPWTT